MLVVKHPYLEAWILLGCARCGEDVPRSIHVEGLGQVCATYSDDEIRIIAPRSIPKSKYREIYDEVMDHYREKRKVS